MTPSPHPGDCEDGWIPCWSCWGEGDEHDCGEDCCCCAQPERDDRVPCDECKGAGGWRCPVCHESRSRKWESPV